MASPPVALPGWWQGIDPEATLWKRWLVTVDVDPADTLAGYRRPRVYRWTPRSAERARRRRQKDNDRLVAAWAQRGVSHRGQTYVVVDIHDDPRRQTWVWFWQKDPERVEG